MAAAAPAVKAARLELIMTSKSPFKPRTICVASARLEHGDVEVTNEAPERLLLHADEQLHVQVRYAYEEDSRDREEFHVRLRSRLANQGPMEQARDAADHRIGHDAEWGVIEQEFEALPPGDHDLVLDVSASYGVRKWRGQGEERLKQSEFAITIPVTVEP